MTVDSEDMWTERTPRRIVGTRQIGWSFNNEQVFPTIEAAQAAARSKVAYPIEWRHVSDSRLEGGHPEYLWWKREFASSDADPMRPFSDAAHEARDNLTARHGFDVCWNCWDICAITEPVSESIPGAVQPHKGCHFFAWERTPGFWGIWEYDVFADDSRFVRNAESRMDAIIGAGQAEYAKERAQFERRDAANSRTYPNSKKWLVHVIVFWLTYWKWIIAVALALGLASSL